MSFANKLFSSRCFFLIRGKCIIENSVVSQWLLATRFFYPESFSNHPTVLRDDALKSEAISAWPLRAASLLSWKASQEIFCTSHGDPSSPGSASPPISQHLPTSLVKAYLNEQPPISCKMGLGTRAYMVSNGQDERGNYNYAVFSTISNQHIVSLRAVETSAFRHTEGSAEYSSPTKTVIWSSVPRYCALETTPAYFKLCGSQTTAVMDANREWMRLIEW